MLGSDTISWPEFIWTCMAAAFVVLHLWLLRTALDANSAAHDPDVYRASAIEPELLWVKAMGRLLRALGLLGVQVLFLLAGVMAMTRVNLPVTWVSWLTVACLMGGESILGLVGLSDLRDGRVIARMRANGRGG